MELQTPSVVCHYSHQKDEKRTTTKQSSDLSHSNDSATKDKEKGPMRLIDKREATRSLVRCAIVHWENKGGGKAL